MLFLQGGASLQFEMIPLNLLRGRPVGRLRAHRRVVEEGDQRGSRRWVGPRSTSPRRPRTAPSPTSRPRTAGTQPRTRRTSTTPPTRPSAGSSSPSCPRSATCHWSPTCRRHLVPAGRRGAVRADLRRGAEEHRPGRADHRDHARRPGRAGRPAAHPDARLRHARQGRLDVQHAADVRDLHRRTGLRRAAGATAVWPPPSSATSPRRACCTGSWTAPTSTPTRSIRPPAPG